MKQNIYDHPEFFNMYAELRQSKVTYNDFVEQPAMKRLLPSVADQDVLDLGCGFGDFALYVAEQGARSVLGVDLSRNMLARAKQHPKIAYRRGSMEDLTLDDASFDVIVSSLAFHYVEDYQSLMRKVAGWLRPGGTLLFSTEHPVATAHQAQTGWVTNAQGERVHWPLDDYGEEGRREQFWGVDGVVKYHRRMSTLVNALIDCGLSIERIEEPESIPEGLEALPSLTHERRRPSFLLIKSKKP